ncbi:DUF2075 domain-containing protein [Elusimicrobiota bacterium]
MDYMNRSYYENSILNFLATSDDQILGMIITEHHYSLEDQQKNAWIEQIKILKNNISDFKKGHIFFEFAIPRMGKRVDNILVINNLIFVIEFKVNSKNYENYAKEQVIDYCLDLKNFHEGSHAQQLIPILVSTNALSVDFNKQDNSCFCTNATDLGSMISSILETYHNENYFDITYWKNSPYKPTPTIVEAAKCLFAGHNVKEISRSDAGAINLSKTTESINEIIKFSKTNKQKSICFITGVPGSGKTLAGLNIATTSSNLSKDEHATFLSGNGPLVQVLQEALTRDEKQRNNISKKLAAQKVKAFIQNIHHFRDEGIKDGNPPDEKIVIFDEAQRAWDQKQLESFMQRKKGISNFHDSEPEFLIKVMDRHKDWCVIICLIGEGQEINNGEAGLEEWLSSIKRSFHNWNVYYSPRIKEYLNGDILSMENTLYSNDDLHLGVSLRSFRSEKLAEYIENIVNCKTQEAKNLFEDLKKQYPIFITRNLKEAKKWILSKAKGSERYGLIASSNAIRLRPEGIDVQNKIDTPCWFLNDNNDIRSSYFMELVASEFDIQGLELDWVICGWDINLRKKQNSWDFFNFKGTNWQHINKEEDQKYLLNSYRVLLTRARQGMVIFVPEGSSNDNTREPSYYDAIFNYLLRCGIPKL